MNLEVLEKARLRVPSIPVLVNLVSQRTKQLNRGEHPFVEPLSKFEDKADIALREIAEGLVIASVDMQAVEEHDEKRTQWSRHI
ncbi:MAG: DNA-directed RNA polymerase subunit omega [Kiritimatiellae bacterium]|nr:DNA-directed RNA polymerase subunit omega [Kiritimatiellia bacterium]